MSKSFNIKRDESFTNNYLTCNTSRKQIVKTINTRRTARKVKRVSWESLSLQGE